MVQHCTTLSLHQKPCEPALLVQSVPAVSRICNGRRTPEQLERGTHTAGRVNGLDPKARSLALPVWTAEQPAGTAAFVWLLQARWPQTSVAPPLPQPARPLEGNRMRR